MGAFVGVRGDLETFMMPPAASSRASSSSLSRDLDVYGCGLEAAAAAPAAAAAVRAA
eukprot:CAMPEP_0194060716 /NCGR_PEP_ID=MMETSP0009_2-20130614/72570_1 /TAXON_ID=210454 /ORGANISM="Grammatophora oceanica, Strain CCMP 410" /LENGTH=56 /DNA_ID=CAMNT_0038711729 /DNA_START=42 /DNA_END=208 /DNA_ORIENTATION=+